MHFSLEQSFHSINIVICVLIFLLVRISQVNFYMNGPICKRHKILTSQNYTLILTNAPEYQLILYDLEFIICCPKYHVYFAEMNRHFSHPLTQQNLDLDTSLCNLRFSSICVFLSGIYQGSSRLYTLLWQTVVMLRRLTLRTAMPICLV